MAIPKHRGGPVVNFLTLGHLQPYLLGSLGWAVGAAIISSNGKFRDGHAYQGLFGWINAWFCGMFFFYLMFTYGILASIIVHFLYDILIFIVVYLDAVIERARGRTVTDNFIRFEEYGNYPKRR